MSWVRYEDHWGIENLRVWSESLAKEVPFDDESLYFITNIGLPARDPLYGVGGVSFDVNELHGLSSVDSDLLAFGDDGAFGMFLVSKKNARISYSRPRESSDIVGANSTLAGFAKFLTLHRTLVEVLRPVWGHEDVVERGIQHLALLLEFLDKEAMSPGSYWHKALGDMREYVDYEREL